MKLNISTYTAVVGTESCNANCPFCVSKQTCKENLKVKEPNWRNFEIGCRIAAKTGVTTLLLTGKGEPTLYPDLITEYIKRGSKYFPIIELQTNAIKIIKDYDYADVSYLTDWYNKGLTTICISAVNHLNEPNKNLFGNDDYPHLEDLIDILHSYGYSVRLNITVLKDFYKTPEDIEETIYFAKENNVEQLTFRPATSNTSNIHTKEYEWTEKHKFNNNEWNEITQCIEEEGVPLMNLTHGGIVYDVDGQNVCLSNCLTLNTDDDVLRQLIFFPDGRLGYDWRFKGATIL